MGVKSGFFNSKGNDRLYTAEDFTEYLSTLICDGVLDNFAEKLEVRFRSSTEIEIATGKAWIGGHYFINDSPYVQNVMDYIDGSASRYLAVGVVCDTESRECRFAFRPGTPGQSPEQEHFTNDDAHTYVELGQVFLFSSPDPVYREYIVDTRQYCRCILGKCKVSELLDAYTNYSAAFDEFRAVVEQMQQEAQSTLDAAYQTLEEAKKIIETAYPGIAESEGNLLVDNNGLEVIFPISADNSNALEKKSDGYFVEKPEELTVQATSTLTTGVEIGAVIVNGTVTKFFVPKATSVSASAQLFSGAYIGSITIDGKMTRLYAPAYQQYWAKANGENGISYGTTCEASGVNSIAVGTFSLAVGNDSAAVGNNCTAGDNFSFATGEGSFASGQSQFVCGKYNDINNEYIFVVGNGTASKRKNAVAVREDGNIEVSGTPTSDCDAATKKYVDLLFLKLKTAIEGMGGTVSD